MKNEETAVDRISIRFLRGNCMYLHITCLLGTAKENVDNNLLQGRRKLKNIGGGGTRNVN